MSAADTQRLVSAPSQQAAVNIETPGARSSRVYKVTGLTLLACVLIMGQAAITYFLVNQRSDIKSLQEQNDRMRTDLTKARSVSVPMRMQMPSNTLIADFLDEEASTGTAQKEPARLTQCQLESAGLKPLQVPSYRPVCDQLGLYRVQQCFASECWCVSPTTGEQIPGSLANGQASCGSAGKAPRHGIRKNLSVMAAMPILDTSE